MKTKTVSAVIAFASLTALSGAASAGAHDGYYQAFYGHADSTVQATGKAAYGTPSGSTWSGHEAYRRAFGNDSSSGAPVDTMGKAAFGAASGPDGNAIYHRVFGGNG